MPTKVDNIHHTLVGRFLTMAEAAASSGGIRRGRYGTKSGPRHLLQKTNTQTKVAGEKKGGNTHAHTNERTWAQHRDKSGGRGEVKGNRRICVRYTSYLVRVIARGTTITQP